MARVPYRSREIAGDADQALYDRLEAERRRPTPNIFLALAHAPAQLDGLLTYSTALRRADELGPRLRELAILAIATAKGGDYIAAHHVADAIKAGFTEEQVSAIPHAQDTELFDDLELAVINLARAIGTDAEITDDAWDAVAQHLSDQQLVQLTLTAAWYVAGVLIARTLDLDDQGEPPIR